MDVNIWGPSLAAALIGGLVALIVVLVTKGHDRKLAEDALQRQQWLQVVVLLDQYAGHLLDCLNGGMTGDVVAAVANGQRAQLRAAAVEAVDDRFMEMSVALSDAGESFIAACLPSAAPASGSDAYWTAATQLLSDLLGKVMAWARDRGEDEQMWIDRVKAMPAQIKAVKESGRGQD